MKVAFLTLGCKVNAYETDKMKKTFEDAGHTITSFESYADVYIVNTCTVTNIADRKSRKMLHRARRINPDALIVAAGCYAESAVKKGEEDECADVFVLNKDKSNILEIVCRAVKDSMKDVYHDKENQIYKTEIEKKERTRAYIKVQDGCTQYCTYCIIPYTRGSLKSRSEEDTLTEVRELAGKGYKEVVVTGIHLSSYGADSGNFVKLGGLPLSNLLKAISSVGGIERIRLGSLEPRIITESFVKELSSIPQLCPHFHLSLQSGCNTVLKRMNRHYTAEEYLRCLEILRKYFENPAITTDIITGFPNETEEEFEETCRFVYKAGFAQIHVFKYSKRQGTIAAGMDGQLTEQAKNRRSQRLSIIEKELERLYRESAVKKYEKVLFEEITEINGKKYIVGYNERYIRIAVSIRKEDDTSLCNTIKVVHIIGNLTAEILAAEIL